MASTRVRLNVKLPAKARLKVETKMKPGEKHPVEMRPVVRTEPSPSGPESPSVVYPPALVETKLHFEVRPRVDARTQACNWGEAVAGHVSLVWTRNLKPNLAEVAVEAMLVLMLLA